MLRREGWDESEIDLHLELFLQDYRQANLSGQDQFMLEYVYKLTTAPANITVQDVEKLRRAGFDDRAIHDICAVAAYFAFVNRLADGLGVEQEARFTGQAMHQAGRGENASNLKI